MGKSHHRRQQFVFSWLRAAICLVLLGIIVGAYFLVPRFFDIGVVLDDTNALVFHTIDVGQGDCIVVQFPDDKVLMVDTGKASAYETIVNYLDKLQITTIDWLVITHPDTDHSGSAAKLLANPNLEFKEKFREKSLNPEKYSTTYKKLLDTNEFKTPDDGAVINTGAGYKITFVSPYTLDTINESNDASLMLTIEYYNKIFVLTGDASKTVEPFFVERAGEIFNNLSNKQVILKVGHHGSKYSSGTEFLNFIYNPISTKNNFAIISCGEGNSYNHPHQEALTNLEEHCDQENILITKDVGNIVIRAGENFLTINGKDYKISYTAIFITVGCIVVVLCFYNYKNLKRTR